MAFARTAVSVTGTLTSGSTSITGVSNTSQLWVNMQIYGTGIQSDTLITAIAGTTVTMGKTASASGLQTITGQYITQSGTDTDPTGLAAMTGVTTIDTGSGNGRRTLYNLGANQLRIQGTLTHDPDLFEIYTSIQQGFVVQTGATYNYGIARTVNSQTTYSKGTGLVSTYAGGQFTNFGINFDAGTINWNGGVIKTQGSIQIVSASVISNSYDSVWSMWNGGDTQWRSVYSAATFNKITMQGITHPILLFMNGGWNALGVKFERCAFQTPAGGGANRTILDPVFIGNQNATDIITNQSVNAQQVITVKNPDRFPVLGKLSNNAYMDLPVTEALTLTVTDSINATVGANEVVAYIKDSNNGARLNSTVTTYTTDRTYIAASNASGVISMGDVLTMAGVNANLTNGTINTDYRSNFGNGSADFNIYLGGYGYLQAVTRQTLMGNGGKAVSWTQFSDTNVTLSRTAALALLGTKFTVDPVAKTVTATANATLDELYDATKAYKFQGTTTAFEAPIKDALIISGTGVNLTGYTGWSLIVNTGVTVSAGTKFTYVYFPTVTLNGTGKITAVYASTAGTSTTFQFQSVAVGTTLIIYDASGTTKYFQQEVTSAGTYSYYIPPGTTGTYYWAIESYGKKRETGSFAANTGGLLYYVPAYAEDVGITQATKATVAAYTALETNSKVYDYVAYKRLSEAFIKIGQITTRSGTSIEWISGYNVRIKSTNASVFSLTGTTFYIKSSALAGDTKYTTNILVPPATMEADTTEVITTEIEDGNGDSSITVSASSVSTFEVWKITDATDPDDYATGTLVDTIGIGKWRFLHADGYKFVIRDTTTNYRVVVEAEKGIYEAQLFFGAAVQLAQAAEVSEINTKVDVMAIDLDAIKGTGFTKDKHSLTNIKKKAALAAALSA